MAAILTGQLPLIGYRWLEGEPASDNAHGSGTRMHGP
jgi:hypothetical protein